MQGKVVLQADDIHFIETVVMPTPAQWHIAKKQRSCFASLETFRQALLGKVHAPSCIFTTLSQAVCIRAALSTRRAVSTCTTISTH